MNHSLKGVAAALICLAAAHDAAADSLFNQRTAMAGTLVSSERIRFQPGDLITVLVRESVSASTESDLDTKKESTVESQAAADANPFLAGRGSRGLGVKMLPEWNIEAENEHKADGSTSRANRLTLTVACTVTQVFDNGNIFIEGNKMVKVNREDTMIELSGTVRARDVAADNSVLSSQIANASIQLTGKGPLWNNQRRGFFTKLLDWFSPF